MNFWSFISNFNPIVSLRNTHNSVSLFFVYIKIFKVWHPHKIIDNHIVAQLRKSTQKILIHSNIHLIRGHTTTHNIVGCQNQIIRLVFRISITFLCFSKVFGNGFPHKIASNQSGVVEVDFVEQCVIKLPFHCRKDNY